MFLLKAAIDYKAHEAIGLDGALAKLYAQSYGPWILGVVAAGLSLRALLAHRRALPAHLGQVSRHSSAERTAASIAISRPGSSALRPSLATARSWIASSSRLETDSKGAR